MAKKVMACDDCSLSVGSSLPTTGEVCRVVATERVTSACEATHRIAGRVARLTPSQNLAGTLHNGQTHSQNADQIGDVGSMVSCG